jgi:hypothetical protein
LTHPALAAFGGWLETSWFDLTVMSDPEVVAFELPKLAGLRKQGFHVIERTVAPPRKARGASQETQPSKPPKRIAGKLAAVLEGAGFLRAVASCRSRLFFESEAVLFFADIPTAKLKQRAANKLRRELIGIGVRACVLHADEELTTLMAWPQAEEAITAFVVAAEPEYPLHPEWDADPRVPATRGTAPARDGAREAKLLRQIAELQGQVEQLSRAQSAVGAMEQLGLDDAKLKSMLVLLHPDKHGGSAAANEAAKWVNQMRDLLKGK